MSRESSNPSPRERCFAILDMSSTPMALLTPDGMIVWPNPAFSSLCGRAAENLPGRHFAFLSTEPEACRRTFETRRRRIATRLRPSENDEALPVEFAFDYPAKASPDDFAVLAVHHLAGTCAVGRRHSMRWPRAEENGGGICELDAAQAAITERASIQQRLAESEERWRFAIEGHGDGLWDWDLTTGTVYRSPRWLALLNLPDAPAKARIEDLEHCTFPDDLPGLRRDIRLLLKGVAEEISGECRMRRFGGDVIWVAYRSRVMRRAPGGKATRLIGTLREITARKRRQLELDAQMEGLLHRGRLLALGEMASAIAHEINQPLTSIANYASACVRLLPEGLDDIRQIARRIEEQALRAGQVIWFMRNFARPGDFRCRPVELASLLRGLLDLLALDSRSQAVEFRVEIPEDLPAVTADRVLIEQVLLNLIHNGIHSMAEVAVKPEIVLAAEAHAARDEVVIRVADRGCGLPAEIADGNFRPFFSTKPGGLGLGLSISNSIVARHGGKLWPTPRPGGGTVFSFSLPIAGGREDVSGRAGKADE